MSLSVAVFAISPLRSPRNYLLARAQRALSAHGIAGRVGRPFVMVRQLFVFSRPGLRTGSRNEWRAGSTFWAQASFPAPFVSLIRHSAPASRISQTRSPHYAPTSPVAASPRPSKFWVLFLLTASLRQSQRTGPSHGGSGWGRNGKLRQGGCRESRTRQSGAGSATASAHRTAA